MKLSHDNTVVVKGGYPLYARAVRPATYDLLLRILAANVRSARVKLDLSQEEAADRAGMPPRQWQRVESGAAVTLRTVVAVAAALGVEVSELLRR